MRVITAVKTRTSTKVSYLIGLTMFTAGVAILVFGLAMLLVSLPPFPGSPGDSTVQMLSTANSATLTWTAPGDDAAAGQASQYDIRYDTQPITEGNFALSRQVASPPLPRLAGQPESVTVSGLSANTTYYFALKSADEVPNWSAISNMTSLTTTAPQLACTPDWSCTDWSVCTVEKQQRTCLDRQQCGSDLGKPIEEQACTAEVAVEPCREQWSCTAWAACQAGTQSRICTDAAACGTSVQKPTETADCSAGGDGPPGPSEDILAAIPWQGAAAQVRVYDRRLKLTRAFLANSATQRTGGTVAVGDTDGDGQWNVVTGSGIGSVPLLRVWTAEGRRIASLNPFGIQQKTGVQVAAGDLDGDRVDEILVTPAGQAAGRIMVFQYNVTSKKYERLASFQPLPSSYRAGLSLTLADTNHDDRDELIVAPAGEARPVIRIYRFDLRSRSFRQVRSFSVFSSRDRQGLQIASGDVDNNGDPEIIVARRKGAPPIVQVYTAQGRRQAQFAASSGRYRGGVTLATLDTNLDGQSEIVTGVSDSGPPGLFVFRRNPATRRFARVQSLNAFSRGVQDGVRLSGSH